MEKYNERKEDPPVITEGQIVHLKKIQGRNWIQDIQKENVEKMEKKQLK